MSRRNVAVLGILLVLTWIVVFWLVMNFTGGDDVVFVTPTARPIRTDVPEIQVNVPTPTRIPLESLQATATARYTLSPLEIEFPEEERPENIPADATLPPDGAYPIRLAIPELGIVAAVVVVQTDENFVITTPRDEVGYYALTSKIGGGGNSVLIGHVYPGRVFNNLLDAEIGQRIRITDQYYNEHYYLIEEVRRVPYEEADDEQRIESFNYIYDESEERLTLVTCYPEYDWTHRFVVRAIPVAPPDAAAPEATPAENTGG